MSGAKKFDFIFCAPMRRASISKRGQDVRGFDSCVGQQRLVVRPRRAPVDGAIFFPKDSD